MKIFLFSAFLVTVRAYTAPLEGHRETQNVNPEMSHSIELLMLELQKYRQHTDNKFESLKAACQSHNEEQTKIIVDSDEEKKLQSTMADFEDKMLRFSNVTIEKIRREMSEAFTNALKEFDAKLQPLQSEIASLKSQISAMITKEDLDRLENTLVAVGVNSTTIIKDEMAKLLTEEDMKEHHNEIMLKLKEIANVSESEVVCGGSSKLEEILENLNKSSHDIEEVSAYLKSDSRISQCFSAMDGITELMEKLDENIGGNTQSVTALDTMVQNMQKKFLDELENLRTLSKPDGESQTPETHTSKDPVPSECVDSKFVGHGRSLNICRAAVRFQKCHLEFVAFHCCRSCQEAGEISSVPHYTGPRTLTVLQALKTMKPFP